ncbi:unnamed protein product [Arabidopsis halleri]
MAVSPEELDAKKRSLTLANVLSVEGSNFVGSEERDKKSMLDKMVRGFTVSSLCNKK